MEDMKMVVSGFFTRNGKKTVSVAFMRGKDYAEGSLPDGLVERAEGFSKKEVEGLEKFMRNHQDEIYAQAKEINPIRSWLKE